MNINDQNHAGVPKAPQPHPVRNPRDFVRQQVQETVTKTISAAAEQDIRRNHEALMKFFADADKQTPDQSTAGQQTDGTPLFTPTLFTPELSEPLSIIGEGEEEPLQTDTPVPSAFASFVSEDAPTASPAADPASELRAMVTAAISEEEPPPPSPAEHVTVDDSALPITMIQTDPPEDAEKTASVTPCNTGSRRILRTAAVVLLSLLGVLLLAFGTLTGILFFESRSQTVDLDERPTLGLIETNPLFSSLTAYSMTPDDIDTSAIADKSIDLVFWGFLRRTAEIAVRDLTPPAVSVYRITQPIGFVPDPQLCVQSCQDKTEVVFAFESDPDTQSTGEKTVNLHVTDKGGNTTVVPVTVRVQSNADSEPIHVEFGTREDGILAALSDGRPTLTDFDLSVIDITATGDYYVTGTNRGDETSRYITHVILRDTKPPVGRPHSFTCAAADMTDDRMLPPEKFVTEISDASPVTLSFKLAPDYRKYETQEIVVTATDEAGNATDFFCQLQLLDIPDAITVECGTPTEDFYSDLFQKVPEDDRPKPLTAFDSASILPGDHTIALRGKYSTLSVRVTARDTVPPTLTVNPVIAYVGSLPDASAFVSEVKDATEVTLSYLNTPDVSSEGTRNVTVVATDAGGNKTKAETTMTVLLDTKPPVFSGIQTIYAQENSTISYRKNVSAYDNADGAVAVKVDASSVDVTKSGTYVITYTATDKAGNVATQKAYVIITGANLTTINMYADQVLNAILTPGMTDRQKASAIYTWCVGHLRYSTSTSHLMGKYLQAAYSGFVTRAGNCYTYYAVASALFTRAGIENLEIQRVKPNNPHYWNLVKIDGSWYHLDTCPKMKKYPIKAFLLTDSQVAEYSRTQAENYYAFDASLYPATP